MTEPAPKKSANKVRGLHHFAVGTTDMAATKEFYSGLIGLPHTQTWREEFPDAKKGALSYMHCFFELGDGSALAFFQFAEGHRKPPEKLPSQVFDHHIALRLDNVDEVLAMRQKLKAAGKSSAIIDHGYCYSLYTRDPNNLLVEFTTDAEGSEALLAEKAETADDELRRWLSGDRNISNFHRNYDSDHNGLKYPISTMEEIEEVAVPPEQR